MKEIEAIIKPVTPVSAGEVEEAPVAVGATGMTVSEEIMGIRTGERAYDAI